MFQASRGSGARGPAAALGQGTCPSGQDSQGAFHRESNKAVVLTLLENQLIIIEEKNFPL